VHALFASLVAATTSGCAAHQIYEVSEANNKGIAFLSLIPMNQEVRTYEQAWSRVDVTLDLSIGPEKSEKHQYFAWSTYVRATADPAHSVNAIRNTIWVALHESADLEKLLKSMNDALAMGEATEPAVIDAGSLIGSKLPPSVTFAPSYNCRRRSPSTSMPGRPMVALPRQTSNSTSAGCLRRRMLARPTRSRRHSPRRSGQSLAPS
jgi:hypothetical protein